MIPTRRTGATLLVAYVVTLAFIALWPEPVDRGVSPLLHRLDEIVPWITYNRVEVTANVALFVPYGALLTFALGRSSHLVLPVAIVTTVGIEAAQTLLPERTTSVVDIIANTTGACLGLLAASAAVALRRRREARDAAHRPAGRMAVDGVGERRG
ncbi:VanZ family protein [Microbacterium radiodurans]|uniref:VanZ family protein n=1 Tax=Microbacterium radiodurans TaxID=661398 RepID=A0A5J5ISL2_9MICO|nr:VanZ family protein [Microbacterium radiodurans]KAA9087290.1 VanZ family protein [Microbacterium radiodurans]